MLDSGAIRANTAIIGVGGITVEGSDPPPSERKKMDEKLASGGEAFGIGVAVGPS